MTIIPAIAFAVSLPTFILIISLLSLAYNTHCRMASIIATLIRNLTLGYA